MWRRCLVISLAIVSCAGVPRPSGKRELQRLVRLPRIEFASPLQFDRVSGFVVFPSESTAASDVAEVLKESKGTLQDASLHLAAARLYAGGGDLASSIRSYARAADLFGRRAELEPGNVRALIGLADACTGLGRFSEAQSALDKAAAASPGDSEIDRALGRFYKEKAWSAFVGEEHRFSSGRFLEVLQSAVRRGAGARIDSAAANLRQARERMSRITGKLLEDASFLQERATFRSFEAALQKAFEMAQGGEITSRQLRSTLFNPEALADLDRAAELEPDDPELISSAAFATIYQDASGIEQTTWPGFSAESRAAVLTLCRRLQALAEAGGKEAAEAAELRGCVQAFLVNDYTGAERSLRGALRTQPLRERAWDLLVFSALSDGNASRLVEVCEDRSAQLPNPRSSALLIKSYDRQGDTTRAQWNALIAAGIYPNDFQLNLSLAAVLLKRDDYEEVLWRVSDALNKAEKQLGAFASGQSRIDFILLKSIYLGLSNQADEAKALLRPYISAGPELQELWRTLDFEP